MPSTSPSRPIAPSDRLVLDPRGTQNRLRARSCHQPRRRAGRELVLLFALPAIVVPLLAGGESWHVLALIGVLGLGWTIVLARDPTFPRRRWFVLPRRTILWRWLLSRALAVGALLLLALALARPGSMFAFPREHPGAWLLMSVLYTVLSVYPQEVIFRAAFFHRLAPLFAGRDQLAAGVNALVFGLAHAVYGNLTAVFLATVAGYFFARTYQRSRSLVATSLEHALWGNFAFAIGLGRYFGAGSVTLPLLAS